MCPARGPEHDVDPLVSVGRVAFRAATRIQGEIGDAAVSVEQAPSEIQEIGVRHMDGADREALPWTDPDPDQPVAKRHAADMHVPRVRAVCADPTRSWDAALERL